LDLITPFIKDNMVKTLAIATAVLALTLMVQARPEVNPKELGDRCEPSPNEWKCSLIGGGSNFCNYKTKRCEQSKYILIHKNII
jgi:hypothetical protein